VQCTHLPASDPPSLCPPTRVGPRHNIACNTLPYVFARLGHPDSALNIDDPTGFHGLVNIEQGWLGGPPSDILLAGVHGDSFTYRNDMLTVSSAGKVVDTLRIADPNGVFSVSDTTSGTVISPVFSSAVQQYAGSILHVS